MSPMHSIVEQLKLGDASCLTQDVIFNINNIVMALLYKEPLTKTEQDTVDDILHISNLIYNNTDRSILVLEDGIYDMLLEKYKRYNPNFQVGAEPVTIGNFGTADVINDTDEIQSDPLFVFQPYIDTKNYMFGSELTRQDVYGNALIDNSGNIYSAKLKKIENKDE